MARSEWLSSQTKQIFVQPSQDKVMLNLFKTESRRAGKNYFLKVLKLTALYTVLGFMLQALFVNLLMASSPAEAQNLKDIRVKVNAVNVTLEQAFQILEQKTDFKFNYIKEELPLNQSATVIVEDESLYNILEVFARDYGITFNRVNNQITVKKREAGSAELITTAETGTVKGNVTDSSTKESLYGASVSLRGTTKGAYTDSKGNFEINDVKPGKYTVAASYIGYSTEVKTVQVGANQTVEVNLALGQSVVNLDETVVTGSLAERALRESANPISIITPRELQNRNLTSLNTVLETVPGIMLSSGVDVNTTGGRSKGTQYSYLNIRGYVPNGAGFTSGSTKFLVDGVEIFDYTVLNTLDPNQIEKIEVSRGPMSTTLYGAGSAGGIIHIITKRGTGEPKINFRTMYTSRESYIQASNPLNSQYTLSLYGGHENFGYKIGLDYEHLPSSRWGKYASPIDEDDWSLNAALNTTLSNLKIDLRYEYTNSTYGYSYIPTWQKVAEHEGWPTPEKLINAATVSSSNQRDDSRISNVSLNIKHILNDNLFQNLSLGTSQKLSYTNTMTPFSTAGPYYYTLGYDFSNKNVKYFLNYNLKFSDDFKINFTGGFDYLDQHARAQLGYYQTPYADNTYRLTPTTGFGSQNINYRAKTTGFFGEAVLGFWNDLFLTFGLREESNTSWGDGLWSMPRVGLTYVTKLGEDFIVKPRAAWGQSSQGISPQFKVGIITSPTNITLPNPDLVPQTQRGYEVGADIFFTNNYSIGITYYDQFVENMVKVITIPDPTIYYRKYINILGVPNKGIELSGRAIMNPLTFDIAATFNDSKYGVGNHSDPNSPFYEGKRIHGVPSTSLYARLSYNFPDPFSESGKGGTLTIDYKFKGTEVGADYYTYYNVYLATGKYPSLPYKEYEGYSKLGFRFDYWLFNKIALFCDIQNLLNNQNMVAGTYGPLVGRTISFGFNITH